MLEPDPYIGRLIDDLDDSDKRKIRSAVDALIALEHRAVHLLIRIGRSALTVGQIGDVGRRFEDVEISVTPAPERERLLLDRDAARRFADLGVHRLIVYSPRVRDTEGVLRVVGDAARELVEKV